MRLMKGPSI